MTKIRPRLKHQNESLKFMKGKPEVFDMSDPGTMKTRVELDDFAMNRERRKKMVVFAPKSILWNAWANDAAEFQPNLTVSVATADNRGEAFREDADIYVTNVDAVKWMDKNLDEYFWKRVERIVIDESPAFKHHTSARSKAMDHVRDNVEIVRLMTGTPMTRSVLDIWHQAYILDKGKRLGKNFYGFRNHVCTPEQVGRSKDAIEWVDKEGAELVVADLLKDITIRHLFEDCIDIPPNFTYEKEYKLTKKQLRAYEDMERDSIALMKQDRVVSAVNKAAVRTKLLQIASGAVYENPDTYHLIDNERYELVGDLVEARKCSIIFYLWKHQRDEIARELTERKIRFALFDGDATDLQKRMIDQHFKAGFYQAIICHPKSAAHGLTWTRAKTTIWPSVPDDLEWWIQGNKRHHRGGQTEKTENIVIIGKDTIEEGIYYTALAKKRGRMNNLLELMEYRK